MLVSKIVQHKDHGVNCETDVGGSQDCSVRGALNECKWWCGSAAQPAALSSALEQPATSVFSIFFLAMWFIFEKDGSFFSKFRGVSIHHNGVGCEYSLHMTVQGPFTLVAPQNMRGPEIRDHNLFNMTFHPPVIKEQTAPPGRRSSQTLGAVVWTSHSVLWVLWFGLVWVWPDRFWSTLLLVRIRPMPLLFGHNSVKFGVVANWASHKHN